MNPFDRGVPDAVRVESAWPQCTTCSDEGRDGVIVTPASGFGERSLVRTDLGDELVDTTLIDDPRPGQRVLIHAGLAICRIEE